MDFDFWLATFLLLLISVPAGVALSSKNWKLLPISAIGVVLTLWVAENEAKDFNDLSKQVIKEVQNLTK